MRNFLILISLYLAYYTFTYAKMVWKDNQKFASMIIILLALSLPVLSVLLYIYRY